MRSAEILLGDREDLETMFAICFSVLVTVALLSSCAEFVMRVRLTRRDTDKFLWWRRGGDDVVDAYEELFPGTRLPVFRRFAFWGLVVGTLILLVSLLWKSA